MNTRRPTSWNTGLKPSEPGSHPANLPAGWDLVISSSQITIPSPPPLVKDVFGNAAPISFCEIQRFELRGTLIGPSTNPPQADTYTLQLSMRSPTGAKRLYGASTAVRRSDSTFVFERIPIEKVFLSAAAEAPHIVIGLYRNDNCRSTLPALPPASLAMTAPSSGLSTPPTGSASKSPATTSPALPSASPPSTTGLPSTPASSPDPSSQKVPVQTTTSAPLPPIQSISLNVTSRPFTDFPVSNRPIANNPENPLIPMILIQTTPIASYECSY